MKSYLTYINFFILVLLISGCSTTRSLMTEDKHSKDEEKKSGIVNEFFDPLILNDEDLKVKKTISIESQSNQVEQNLSRADSSYQKPEITPGYRVQICAVSEEDRAKQIQRDALLKFIDQEVYLIYDTPYYKVRVGNCLTRYEADKLQQLAVEKGFDDAWVVRTNIVLKRNDDSPLRY
jgi:hypothetical protein